MASPRLTTAFLLLLLSSVIATSGPNYERAALINATYRFDLAYLLNFYDAFRPPLLRLGWTETNSPCEWWGVRCGSLRVVALELEAIGLVGSIPEWSIGGLVALQTLSLAHNSLSGPLPKDFESAFSLHDVYLQNNSFSGNFPRDFDVLVNLERLNLEYNNFSGELPDIKLPRLVRFNVSYNHLTGVIPPGFQNWSASSFLGMPLCGGSLCTDGISPAEAPNPAPAPPHGSPPDLGRKTAPHGSPPGLSSKTPPQGCPPGLSRKLSGGVIAGYVFAAVFAVTVLIAILYLIFVED